MDKGSFMSIVGIVGHLEKL